MINNRERLIGIIGGLLIYASLFCLSIAFEWLWSSKMVEAIHLPSYPFALTLVCAMGIIAYRFFRNPEQNALWLGIAAILVAVIKTVVFAVVGSSPQSPAPLWAILGMSIQLILSPLAIGCGCIYLRRMYKMFPQPAAAAAPDVDGQKAEGT
jgi:hypothetical protein